MRTQGIKIVRMCTCAGRHVSNVTCPCFPHKALSALTSIYTVQT
jgi:hypothetical protein